MGIRDGDLLLSVADNRVTDDNLEEIWERFFLRNSTHLNLAIKVKRNGEEKDLNGQLFRGYVDAKNYVGPLEKPTSVQTDNLTRFVRNM